VPLSCSSSQPCSIAYLIPAPNSGPLALHPALDREGGVDLLDVDAAVERLDAGGELEELSCSGFQIRIGRCVPSAHLSCHMRGVDVGVIAGVPRTQPPPCPISLAVPRDRNGS